MAFELTRADLIALNREDDEYINQKGADAYRDEDYKTAVEYYRLGAAMGNPDSISNLGYCYMYGRDIEKNTDLAIAYFKIAAEMGSIDALYKLGNIYFNGINGVPQDKESGMYYFENAVAEIDEQDAEALNYPSLHFALAKEMMPGGSLETDLDTAFNYLMVAHIGYGVEIENGASYYEDADKEVIKLINDPVFDEIKEMLAEMGEEDDECGCDVHHHH